MSDAATITVAVVAFFGLLVIAAVARGILRSEPRPWRWRRFRLGVFIERELQPRSDDDGPEPPER